MIQSPDHPITQSPNHPITQEEVGYLVGGENARVRLKGIDDEDIQPGYCLSSRANVVPAVRRFEAQLMIVELLEHKSIFSAGYTAVLHVHAGAEESSVLKLTSQINPKTGGRSTEALESPPCTLYPAPCTLHPAPCTLRSRRALESPRIHAHAHVHACMCTHACACACTCPMRTHMHTYTGERSKKAPMFVKSGARLTCTIEVEQPVCIETFDKCPQLGRFTLRDEGKTIGIGKCLKLIQDDE